MQVIEELKSIPIIEIAEKLDIELDSNAVGNCPSGHISEHGICFRIYEDSNTCCCFNCNRGGSVIDLVMMAKDMEDNEAIQWLVENFRPDLKSQYTHQPEEYEKYKKDKDEKDIDVHLKVIQIFM